MNDNEMRIAIAEACGVGPMQDGWLVYHPERKTHMLSSWDRRDCERWLKQHPSMADEGWIVKRSEHYPDYLKDLNACHEMEEMLMPAQCEAYASELCRIVGNYWFQQGKATLKFTNEAWLYATSHATARQRAEAFLRTIGKWED